VGQVQLRLPPAPWDDRCLVSPTTPTTVSGSLKSGTLMRFADRIVAGPRRASHRFVDDRHPKRLKIVAIGEIASPASAESASS